MPVGDPPAGPNAYSFDGAAPVALGLGTAQRTVRDGRLVTFLQAGSIDASFIELTWPQGQTGTFDCAGGGTASVRIDSLTSTASDGPCEVVVTTDGGVDGAVAATWRGYLPTGEADATFIGTASADVVRLGDDHLSALVDGTFRVGTLAYNDGESSAVSTVLSGTVTTALGAGTIAITVPRDVAPTCGATGNVVVVVTGGGLTLSSRGAAPTSQCSVAVFAADGIETALAYTGQVCTGAICGTVTRLSAYATTPQLPAESVTASMNGGATTTATTAANMVGSFQPSGNPAFLPDQASLLFSVDDAASEFNIALTLRANSPMLPGTYPCSSANAGNRVSEAEILQFGQRFASTSCSVTIDAFEVAGGVRFMSGSFDISNATRSGVGTVHSGSGTFVVHF